MAKVKLTEEIVRGLAPRDGEIQSYVWDTRTSGLGVVVSGRSKTYVARAWVYEAGKEPVRRRVKIGLAGEIKLEAARAAAQKLLGTMGRAGTGVDPNAAKKKARDAEAHPTVREALEFHIGKMERGERRSGKVCSPRSIASTRGFVELHLRDYLDQPLVSLTADVLEAVMTRIEKDTPRRGGSNPNNPPGRATANKAIQMVSKVWNSWDRRHGLPVPNPTKRLIQAALAPRDTRVDNAELPAWYAKLGAADAEGQSVMDPVRRDLYLFSMFSGVRADGVRNLRWEDVDFDDELVTIAKAKGDRPYALPMTATLREILERRQSENASSPKFEALGGDHGFVFPSLSRDTKQVIAVAETKERRIVRDAKGHAILDEDGNAVRENYLPGTHANRRTFNSIAIEIGIPLEARETLMNHEGRGVNVRHYGRPQNWDYLRSCADQIEAALWSRIRGQAKPKGKRSKLRAA